MPPLPPPVADIAPLALLDPLSLAIVLGGIALSLGIATPRPGWAAAWRAAAAGWHPLDADLARRDLARFAALVRARGPLRVGDAEFADGELRDLGRAVIDRRGYGAVAALADAQAAARADARAALIGLLERAAAMAPAFGLIGTIVGLARLFADVGAVAAGTGLPPALGAALLSTVYGALLANLLFDPLAGRIAASGAADAAARAELATAIAALAAEDDARGAGQPLGPRGGSAAGSSGRAAHLRGLAAV